MAWTKCKTQMPPEEKDVLITVFEDTVSKKKRNGTVNTESAMAYVTKGYFYKRGGECVWFYADRHLSIRTVFCGENEYTSKDGKVKIISWDELPETDDLKEENTSGTEKEPEEENIYLIPVVYSMYGRVEAKGRTPEEALEWAVENAYELPLPDDASYLEDSFEVDEEGIILDQYGNIVN